MSKAHGISVFISNVHHHFATKIATTWRCHTDFLSSWTVWTGETAAENESKMEEKKAVSRLQRSVLARCGPLARALARHKRKADGQLVSPEAPAK